MRELLKLLVVLTTGIFIGATTIAHSQEDFLHRLKRSLNPQMAATHDFQAAAEAYNTALRSSRLRPASQSGRS
jgi:hypothetical protein